MTPSAARERPNTRSKSASSAAPLISGSSWIAPSGEQTHRAPPGDGIGGEAGADAQLLEADLVEGHGHRRAPQPHLHQGAGAGDDLERAGDRGRGAGALDDDVRRVAGERLFRGRGLEAEAARELEARLVVRHPAQVHATAVGARDLRRQQSDRPRSDHQHLVARIDARGVRERVADAGQGLADRRRVIAQRVR